MKLKNIFKKGEKKAVKANVEKLDKNQLEKVVGGAAEPVKVAIGNVDTAINLRL